MFGRIGMAELFIIGFLLILIFVALIFIIKIGNSSKRR